LKKKNAVKMQDLHHRRFILEGSLVFDCICKLA